MTRWTRTVQVLAATAMLAAALVVGGGPASAGGAEQVGGLAVPWPVAPATCDPGAVPGADYILAMPAGSGDLTGCLYGFREEVTLSAGGVLSARGPEVFVGCHGDRCGSFELEAHIEAKWEGLPGASNQIWGRCQHKIVRGTGTGDFEGVTGRLDFKDIILRDADGDQIGVEFDYRGHLRLG